MFQSSVIVFVLDSSTGHVLKLWLFSTQSHEVVISENIITWILEGRSLEQGVCLWALYPFYYENICFTFLIPRDRLVLGVSGLLYLLIWMGHLRSLVGTCGGGLSDCHIIDGLFDTGSHCISVFLKVCMIVLCGCHFFTVCVHKAVLRCWVSIFWPHCHPLWQVWEVV